MSLYQWARDLTSAKPSQQQLYILTEQALKSSDEEALVALVEQYPLEMTQVITSHQTHFVPQPNNGFFSPTLWNMVAPKNTVDNFTNFVAKNTLHKTTEQAHQVLAKWCVDSKLLDNATISELSYLYFFSGRHDMFSIARKIEQHSNFKHINMDKALQHNESNIDFYASLYNALGKKQHLFFITMFYQIAHSNAIEKAHRIATEDSVLNTILLRNIFKDNNLLFLSKLCEHPYMVESISRLFNIGLNTGLEIGRAPIPDWIKNNDEKIHSLAGLAVCHGHAHLLPSMLAADPQAVNQVFNNPLLASHFFITNQRDLTHANKHTWVNFFSQILAQPQDGEGNTLAHYCVGSIRDNNAAIETLYTIFPDQRAIPNKNGKTPLDWLAIRIDQNKINNIEDKYVRKMLQRETTKAGTPSVKRKI